MCSSDLDSHLKTSLNDNDDDDDYKDGEKECDNESLAEMSER